MRVLRRITALGVLLWLGLVGVAFAADAPSPSAADSSQQVLVLLRLPADHVRPGAGYADSYGDGAGLAARLRIASRLAREHGLTVATRWPMPLLGVDCFVLTVPADQSPQAVAATLARDPHVAASEPMHFYRAQGQAPAPNDPLFPTQPAARAWRLADLHQIATGRNVRVAVVDSQIEVNHPDLAGQVQINQDFVLDHPSPGEQHGTAVAGIIAAVADNGLGIAGVAPRARLLALRACWQQPSAPATICDTLSLAKALNFAVDHHAQIINLSLSGPSDFLLDRLVDAALARDIVVVGAVDPNQPDGGFPASHAGVVAVTDDPASAVAGVFVAPGRDVPTTQPGGRWFLVSGSSYAAAHVSGLFALLRERKATARGAALLVSLRPGRGRIDAYATLVRAGGPCARACAQQAAYSAIARR